jgi:hypothetical protein
MNKSHVDLCDVCARLEWAGWELLKRGFVAPLRFTLAYKDGPIDCIQEPNGTAVAVPVEIHYVDAENHEAHATVDSRGMALRVGDEVLRA